MRLVIHVLTVFPLLAGGMVDLGAVEMQVRDIRIAVGVQHLHLQPEFLPQGAPLTNGYTATETEANKRIFSGSSQATGIGISTTNGLLDQYGGLLWKVGLDFQQFRRSVDGTMVGKAGSTTSPNAYYQMLGVRTHLGYGYAFTDYLHAEALPFVGAGLTHLSFPAWAEEYTVGGVEHMVGYWVQPTGNGLFLEGGVQLGLVYTSPWKLQAGLQGTWSYARSRSTVNGWQYRNPAIVYPLTPEDPAGAWVTDEADVVMRSQSFTLAAVLGWRF